MSSASLLQGVHADSKQNSEDLARAVCALSVLRVHLKDKENNPLKDVKYDPFSRYLPGVPVRSMAQKLRTFSRPLLLKKHHEIISYAGYMEPRMAGLGSSQALAQDSSRSTCFDFGCPLPPLLGRAL